MNKQHILVEIARTAVANGGNPLGKERFFKETGIKESDWAGKYWARWSDAVTEAGCAPNRLQQPLDEEGLLQALAETVRELGHWPVITELKLRARQVPGFPSHNTFRRFGSKDDQISKLITYCEAGPAWRDVADTLRASHRSEAAPIQNESALPTEIGYVYLLKANRYFKIGRSSLFERRSRQLAIQLPEKAETIHVIRTDDPVGIELYWHRRFEAKRKNGEWFELSAEDVKTFRRRKFM